MLTLPPNVQPTASQSTSSQQSPRRDRYDLADVAVVIVAYNAEQTIASVLDRLPQTFAEHVGAILVSDDGSSDATTEVARRWAATHPHVNLTVVQQPINLGYGGNQKFCYRWALEHDCSIAVMVHGDGQYAPELVGSIIAPLLRGGADAVFGSRMLIPGGARKGGMPMYKFVGNRILTTVQNLCAGLRLSEWHSGYRAYNLHRLDVAGLAKMSDGFDFDTEIILSLAKRKRTITEVPIPTFYGNEKCNVNGMRYAVDVLGEVIKFRARRNEPSVELMNAA